jgi:hypothetical protein
MGPSVRRGCRRPPVPAVESRSRESLNPNPSHVMGGPPAGGHSEGNWHTRPGRHGARVERPEVRISNEH